MEALKKNFLKFAKPYVNMKTIKENNRIIAEFMGAKYNKDTSFPMRHDELWLPIHGVCNFIGTNGKRLRYDSSWDWLMSVVEKIESIIFDDDTSFNVTIGSTNYCVIQDSIGEVYESIEDYGNSKLETVYKTVVQFIKWYNKQKQIKP